MLFRVPCAEQERTQANVPLTQSDAIERKEAAMKSIVIITTGNEVLNGSVLDTNTNWLCKRFTAMGGFVASAALIRDDVGAITGAIRAALDQSAHLIVTTGGLGPTADDLTLQAVAQATGRPLVIQPDALEQVTSTYADLAARGVVHDGAITPAREKMARLPQGALPLANPVGAAPGVYLVLGNAAIVSLPGVPAELRAIFEGALRPELRSLFGASVFLEKTALVASGDESVLAPVLHTVAQRHPDLYIKSHAERFGVDVAFRVTVSKAGATRDEVARDLDDALRSLTQALRSQNIAIRSIQETGDYQP